MKNPSLIKMNTIEAIMTRRSIRAFKSTPVSKDAIQQILQAAMNAPSAAEQRPWHFVVISRRELLDALADAVDEGNPMLKQAQAAILLCIDPALVKLAGYGEKDCACAAQNIQLAAHDLGLGTVWISIQGIPPRENGCRSLLSLPDAICPFALFPLGEPMEKLPARQNFDATRVHHDKW